MCSIDWKLVIDAVAAAATIAVAVLAVWGDWVRARFAPPRIELRLHTPQGIDAILGDGRRTRYYHLKPLNISPLAVQDCRILLCGMRVLAEDGVWTEIPFPVPFPLRWSGEEPGPEFVNITTDRILDFGVLTTNNTTNNTVFTPCLRYRPVNFSGVVIKGFQPMRYDLKVDARSYWSAKPQTFEVSWDGEFPIASIPK